MNLRCLWSHEPSGQLLLQLLAGHVGEDLGGADVRVAEYVLDVPDIGPSLAPLYPRVAAVFGQLDVNTLTTYAAKS